MTHCIILKYNLRTKHTWCIFANMHDFGLTSTTCRSRISTQEQMLWLLTVQGASASTRRTAGLSVRPGFREAQKHAELSRHTGFDSFTERARLTLVRSQEQSGRLDVHFHSCAGVWRSVISAVNGNHGLMLSWEINQRREHRGQILWSFQINLWVQEDLQNNKTAINSCNI